MGEIAEMMLDGTLCQDCGAFIGNGDGIPRNCGCGQRVSRGAKRAGAQKKKGPKLAVVVEKVRCEACGKRVKAGRGLADHMRAVHGEGHSKEDILRASLPVLKRALHDLVTSHGLYACDNEEGHSLFRLEHASISSLRDLLEKLEVSA